MKKNVFLHRLLSVLLVLCLSVLSVSATEPTTSVLVPPKVVISEGNSGQTQTGNETERVQSTVDVNDMSVMMGCHGIDAQVPMLGQNQINNVSAAFLYDYTNDTLIYSLNPDLQQYPTSLVKIMTGLILAERADMSAEITVRADVLEDLPANSLGIGLQADEVIPMRELFYSILVESANDAAAVAADHISGSQEAFVAEMNRYAAELGCTNTNFTNVHGIHDPEQYSTARDLARILAKAAENELFMEAFSTVNYTVPATNMSEERTLSSNNYLMNDDMMTIYLDSRVTGGRAGTTDTGERNLAVTAERNEIKLVSIVLGSTSIVAEDGWRVIEFGSYKETSQLLDMGFQGHHSVQLFYADQALKQYEVVNGESYVSTGIVDAVNVLLPYGVTYDDLDYRYNEDTAIINAPIRKGDKVSTVQVWHNEVCLAQADLFALHDVNVAQTVAVEQIEENTYTQTPTILIFVVIIVGLLLLLLFGRRIVMRLVQRRRVRKHYRNHRRSR